VGVDSLGYLVCEKCSGYYELKEGESINNFESCECGGELTYHNSIEFLNEEENLNNLIFCPSCGKETPIEGKFCAECGMDLNSKNNLEIESVKQENNHYTNESLKQNAVWTMDGYHNKYKKKKIETAINKGNLKVQKTLEVQGKYDVKGSGDAKIITLLTDGLLIDDTQKIKYKDIIRFESVKNKDKFKETVGFWLFLPYYMLVQNYRTLKISFNEGEIELNNVKKNDAINCIGFIREKFLNN
jgi:hypothetical protein